MSSPTSVSNARVGLESFGQVRFALRNKLLQLSNLAHFLVGSDFLLLVTIDSQTSRVVTAIFESRKSCRAGVRSQSPKPDTT